MDSSPFSLLPRELRDLIYTFLFTSNYAITLQANHIVHPLIQTCRQVREESLSLYLALTRFNAHLNDHPATPLARWLLTLGHDRCLGLREVNIWDLHMLNGSLHGVKATERMLASGSGIEVSALAEEIGSKQRVYVLKPIGRDIFHGSWYLKDIVLALQQVGLRLRRFCEVQEGSDQLKQTSHFAIQPCAVEDDARQLVGQLGLHKHEIRDLITQLDAGQRVIQLSEGRRIVQLTFDVSRTLVAMQQHPVLRAGESWFRSSKNH